MYSDAAFDALFNTVATGSPQAAIANVDWRKLKALYEARRPRPILEYVSHLPMPLPGPSVASGTPVTEAGEQPLPAAPASEAVALRDRILETSSSDRLQRLVSYVAEVLSRIIGSSAQTLQPATSTHELGLDSLMALETRNRIYSDLQVDIPSARLLQGVTISELARQIAAELPESAVDSPTVDQLRSRLPFPPIPFRTTVSLWRLASARSGFCKRSYPTPIR